MGWSDIINSL